MRWIIAAVATALAVVAAALVCSHANAATLTSHPSPTAQTCAAFRLWHAHRSTGHLDAMVRASLTAPWQNLANDVDVVYADVRGNDRIDLRGDVAGIAFDCHGH